MYDVVAGYQSASGRLGEPPPGAATVTWQMKRCWQAKAFAGDIPTSQVTQVHWILEVIGWLSLHGAPSGGLCHICA